MDLKRLRQVLNYGWNHANDVQALIEKGEFSRIKGRFNIFADIVKCYMSYSMWSNQYKQLKFYALTDEERVSVGNEIKTTNVAKAKWTDYYYRNQRFFKKWGGQEYECSYKLSCKRNKAYTKQYNMGENCAVRQNVFIQSTHGQIGNISIGNSTKIGRNCDIDYTGGLTIGNGVDIASQVIIMTHGHNFVKSMKTYDVIPNTERAYLTPLTIGDNVLIGSNVMILAGVKSIGENSIISAGSVVSCKIPPNSLVAGNPAKILGSIEGLRLVYKYSPKSKE